MEALRFCYSPPPPTVCVWDRSGLDLALGQG